MGWILLGIWSLAFIAVLPTAFYTGTFDITFHGTSLVISHVCAETWPIVSLHLVYSIILMIVQVFTNLFVLVLGLLMLLPMAQHIGTFTVMG